MFSDVAFLWRLA